MCTSCSVLKLGTVAADPAALLRLPVSSIRNQTVSFHFERYQTVTTLGTSSSATWAKIHKTGSQSGQWDSRPQPPLEQSKDTIRDMVFHSTRPGQPHILARAAQASGEAHSMQFASSMLKTIWGPREKYQTLNEKHSFKSQFGDKNNKISAADHLGRSLPLRSRWTKSPEQFRLQQLPSHP